MHELRKFFAPEFIQGPGARHLAGQVLTSLAVQRVLLVSDPGLLAAGWTDEAEHTLVQAGLEVHRFLGVTPNPRDHEVMAGARFHAERGCQAILAVGGGSVMDCAKGIAVVAANGGEVNDYEGVDEVRHPGPPLVCIPTTAGTAADISQFAIISAPREGRKLALISRRLVPDVSLVDPEPLATASPFLRACTGMDALVHAAEALVSNAGSDLTTLLASDALALARTHLGAATTTDDPLHLEGMARASLQAGLAFSNASLGAVHALAHALGGELDLPHGLCNALLLPAVADYNLDSEPEGYRRLAHALGFCAATALPGEVRRSLALGLADLRQALGLSQGLASLGVTPDLLPGLARKAFRDLCLVTNPRRPAPQDLEDLYAAAL